MFAVVKALTHTPSEIFGNMIRYVVPLFQRPYVWNESDQWRPLWDDVAAVAERVLDGPEGFGAPAIAPHFLGAIVVEQQLAPVAFIGVRHVIDGQQRLTTLQLLIDAAQWVTEKHGNAIDAQALLVLVQNNPQLAQDPDHVFKVWPTDRDRPAFRAAMDNDTVVPPELIGTQIAQAHAFFIDQISEWSEIDGDPEKAAQRLAALSRALREHLKVVVIDLEPGDNAQVIFETLNHRGSPLLASDLIKNLIFQVASQQGLDVDNLYRSYWAELDSDYWRESIVQGRYRRPRIDVFLNRWMTMKLLREVKVDRLFTEFRDNIVHVADLDLGALVREIADDAQVFKSMENLPGTSVEGRFQYRVIQALDTEVFGPVLIWVMRHGDDRMPLEQRHRALDAMESWLVRRALCRVTSKDHNRMVIDLLRELVRSGPGVVGDTAERVLSSDGALTRFWPDDAAVRSALTNDSIYKSLTRARLRMILEALEDDIRGPLSEGQACPRGLTVEHVMPQGWRTHWGADIAGDQVAGWNRDQIVQTIGNLTLVNNRLNPALSNHPWTREQTQEQGLEGVSKRELLLQHSTLKLNASLVQEHVDAWTEVDIAERTQAMVARICAIWPVPAEAHQPGGGQTETSEVAGNEAPVSEPKYAPFTEWLSAQESDEVRLSFDQIEGILGAPLPPSAHKWIPHWRSYGGSALARSIQDAGWRVESVKGEEERVVLVRVSGDDAEPEDSEEASAPSMEPSTD